MKKSISLLSIGLFSALSSTIVFANQADNISVEAPYAREVPPGAPASASFMTLINHSSKDIKLVSGHSSASKLTELHSHTNDNGVMRMRQVDSITIPASGKVQLKPGGFHIMLINPYKPLKAGQKISLTLTFKDGSSKAINMPVKSTKGMSMNHKMSMPHSEHNHGHSMEHNHQHMH